ncbi:MAG TPA: DUF6443 domain-containing protein, partial [Mucilaginibacter sp.]|nr:DUF6443 domain-containing protein [Mucilaginibacter sp.]
MKTIHNHKKNRVKGLLQTAGLVFFSLGVRAQTYITPPTTGTLAPGDYYNNLKIQLSPTFSFTPTGSQRLYLFITGPTCLPLATAPSSDKTYIMTSVPRVAGITDTAGLRNRNACELMQTIQYFDGLGRPLQTVQVQGSPTNKDMVQPIAYDTVGREPYKYMPYAPQTGTADGSYRSDAATTGIQNFYHPAGGLSPQQANGVVNTPYPFAQTGFEESPLNRVVEQGAPGQDWQLPGTGDPNSAGHTLKMLYTTNDQTAFSGTDTINNPGSRKVALYTTTINANNSRILARAATPFYATGELSVTITRDENWNPATSGCLNSVEEYKDKEGHIVLKRTYNFNKALHLIEMLSTYYVYDNQGNLAYVLPPMANPDAATGIPSATLLNNYCYWYRYDDRLRLVQKKIPGKGWDFIIYNQLDQPVMTQDSVQRTTNVWTVTKYDAQGRVILTGTWPSAGQSMATLQTAVYAGAQWDVRNYADNTTGYTITSYPTPNKILTINYYDNYTNLPGLPGDFAASGYSTMTTGLLTATKTAILNTLANPTLDMLWTAHYYDDLGRSVRAFLQHDLGGVLSAYNYDDISSTFNFTDQVTATTRVHKVKNSGNTAAVTAATIANSYVYDHMGRKTQTFERINSGKNVLLVQADYNEIGQIRRKNLHGNNTATSFLQTVSYNYNERGWLVKSSAPLFAEQLQYNTDTSKNGMSFVKQYNGNIAGQTYGTAASPSGKSFAYLYDSMNRLTNALSSDNYNERDIRYDLAGNIIRLQRTTGSSTLTDDLTYTYGNTNQAQSISDATGSDLGLLHGGWNYTYDGNGNVKNSTYLVDNTKSKNITAYNILNLPQTGTAAGTAFTYTYDATG